MVEFFQLNQGLIRDKASKARERMQRQAEGGGHSHGGSNLQWYKFKFGENRIRLFPPVNKNGLLFKELGRHYSVPKLNENDNNPICIALSSQQPNVVCPLCEVIDAVKQQYPSYDTWALRPRKAGYAWVLDQTDIAKGPQIAQFSSAIVDWITVQLEHEEFDILNINSGVDIYITKTKTGADPMNVRYSNTLSPVRSPLAPSQEVLQQWMSKMVDLDDVFKIPTGADMDTIMARAIQLREHLTFKASQATLAQHNQSMGSIGFQNTQSMAAPMPPPPPARSSGYPVGPSVQVPYAPGVVPPAQPQQPQVVPQLVMPAAAPQAVKPVPVPQQPLQVPMQPTTPLQLVKTPVSGRKPCFGGATVHPDGSKGYQPHLQICLTCQDEFACVDETAKHGV